MIYDHFPDELLLLAVQDNFSLLQPKNKRSFSFNDNGEIKEAILHYIEILKTIQAS